MIRPVFLYAFRYTIRSPLRSSLVIVTVAMIISLYLLVSSILTSFSDKYAVLFNQDSVDIIIQEKFSATPISSTLGIKSTEKICKDNRVKECTEIIMGKVRLEDGSRIFIIGADNHKKLISAIGISMRSSAIDVIGESDVLVGIHVARKQKLKKGKKFNLFGDKTYNVLGVFHSWISFLNSSIVVRKNTAQTILRRPDKINMLFVSLQNKKDTDNFIDYILKSDKMLMATKSNAYTSSSDIFKTIDRLSLIVTIIVLFVSISILINTFLTAVNERFSEIGILNTMGWDKRSIICMLMAESYILSLAGGILGYLFSLVILESLKKLFFDMSAYLPETMGIDMIFQGIVLCLVVATVSIVPSAYRATKITIVKAIRNG